jgi:SAM-dependent methyltransferase
MVLIQTYNELIAADMPTTSQLREVFSSLIRPWQFMFVSLLYLPGIIWKSIEAGDIQSICSWSRLQHAWFSAFWGWAGPRIRESNAPRITALLDGRVTNARVVDEPVTLPVSGIVLDIGPGAGYWVDLYARTESLIGSPSCGSDAGITKLYGLEPNHALHTNLIERVRGAGLKDVYEIVPAGIQELCHATVLGENQFSLRIEKGSVDCIVSLLCLCSIPDPEVNIKELYSYLKEGGRWYVFEHVRAGKYWPMRLYQGQCNAYSKPIRCNNQCLQL